MSTDGNDFVPPNPTPDFFEPETDIPSFSPLQRLNADLKKASRLLGRSRIQDLVQSYYRVQDVRKAAANQTRSADEPEYLTGWLAKNWQTFENDIKKVMGEVADEYRVGQWLQGLIGIGPVLASGWISGLDLTQAVTVGHWYRLLGLDPGVCWLGRAKAEDEVKKAIISHGPSLEEVLRQVARVMGIRWETLHKWATTKKDGSAQALTKATLSAAAARRPWSNRLKVLAWKTSECFIKFSNHPKQYYGSIYNDRKRYESEKNEAGGYAYAAAYILTGRCNLCKGEVNQGCPVCHGRPEVKPMNYGKDTEAYKSYIKGKLPLGHIHARCMRFTVKMFLSHLHHVMYLDVKGVPPPLPYAFTKVPGNHRHWIPIPNLDLNDPWEVYRGRSLADMQE